MRAVTWLLIASATGLCVLLAAGWLQALHGAFDSISHFRLVLVAILAPICLLLLLLRQWVVIAVASAVMAFSLMLTAPFLPGFGAEDAKADFRVAQFNMLYRNKSPDKIHQVLSQSGADIILLQELVSRNFSAFEKLKKTHPYQFECTAPRWGSVALASRYPIIKGKNTQCSRRLGFLSARIEVDGRCLTVASLHTKWPWPYSQNERLNLLKPAIEKMDGARLLAGDFNAAPWSHSVKRVAGWFEGTIAPGLLLTWSPLMLEFDLNFGLLLPLDHILHSSDLIMGKRVRLPDAGSDHRPVLTQFVWADASETGQQNATAKSCL